MQFHTPVSRVAAGCHPFRRINPRSAALAGLIGVLALTFGQGCPPGGGGQNQCNANADCDDGQFCNGAETCVNGNCQAGSNPCVAGQTCNENTNQCEGGTLTTPSRSTSIALTSDDRFAIVANRETNSVSVIEVRTEAGQDVGNQLAEIPVGREPRFVAISPDDLEAYVTNSASGTVSVISLAGDDLFGVIAEIPVGTEPRGCAVTPNGTRLFVANHTEGTVSIINVDSLSVIGTANVGGNPTAIAITNDQDTDDQDETVFVTDFYAKLIPNGPGEVFDEGKQGFIQSFTVANPNAVVDITISPLANVGFTADRSLFCDQFNASANFHNDIFCPDVNQNDPASPTIIADPQGAYPNQLWSALIRGNRLFLPNVGAGPEPPVKFNVNIQALVNVVDTAQKAERAAETVNLNAQIKTEIQPANPNQSLDRLFGNDIVAIDADTAGAAFLIVSRGGNYVIRASLDAQGKLNIGAPGNVVRFQTGNLPNGIVVSSDGRRAYVNNEVNVSVTTINLQNNTVIARDIPSGEPPVPGTFEHSVLLGKLAFFTALGLPGDDVSNIFDTPIRDINPLADRGKASDNGWSGCGSCHPDGFADGVTWSFGTGPRQTIPLDGFFAKDNPADQRISNYSAVMGSITDFNGNSINVQGGLGFAGTPPNPNIYAHGFTQGGSRAHDLMTLWVQTVRSPIMPVPTNANAEVAGRALFALNCASCHGGSKWTKSQIIYRDNPALSQAGAAIDAGLTIAGPQIVSFTVGANTLRFLENIGTFDIANPLELRGAGAASGQTALGALGFNVPSLLGIGYHAPYFHDGSAQTLQAVFTRHALGGGTIASLLNAGQLANLEIFLKSIDDRTEPIRSATDAFRDLINN